MHELRAVSRILRQRGPRKDDALWDYFECEKTSNFKKQ